MAYDEKLAKRIRDALAGLAQGKEVEEQPKMGGISFLLDGKVCVRAHSDGTLLVRCEPKRTDELLAKKGGRRFEMQGRPTMKGWLLIGPEATRSKKDLDYWVGVSLDFWHKADKEGLKKTPTKRRPRRPVA
jgi:hypothetical protein